MTSKILAYLKRFRMQVLQTFAENLDSNTLKITLCDRNLEMTKHWHTAFEGIPNVEILCGNIFDVYADAIVSPANSFGDMGGGIDQHIDNFYKGKAQKKVQEMRTAYDNVYLQEWKKVVHPAMASYALFPHK